MKTITMESSLGTLVNERASRARIFEQFGLDYCCRGRMSLKEACKEKGIDPAEVLTALKSNASGDNETDNKDWFNVPLAELADHIEATHHVYLRRELPPLAELVAKVSAAHSARHPELSNVMQTLEDLQAELSQHMIKEEEILFPLIRRMESHGAIPAHCGSVANPIRVMETEHDNAGNALSNIREITNNFAAPDDACASYRAMLTSLADLECDLHQHIHKENNILFPRAIACEEELAAR